VTTPLIKEGGNPCGCQEDEWRPIKINMGRANLHLFNDIISGRSSWGRRIETGYGFLGGHVKL